MGELAIPNREYETIYILKPDTARDAAESLATRLVDVVNGSGRLTKVENWGRRRLAYAVSNQKRGIYVYMTYEGQGDVVPEVERALRLHESVMKFQTVKVSDAPKAGEISVDDVQFEHVAEDDQDEEESFAESLGLEARGRGGSSDSDSASERESDESGEDDSDDSESDSDGSDDDGAGADDQPEEEE
jgi:small subunit ribosomal protein S6